MKPTLPVFLVSLLVLGAGPGCKSISASLTSPSDSISGTGNAISGSFGAFSDGISQSCSGTKPSASGMVYGEDVRIFAAAFVRAGEPTAQFLAGLALVAERHGVSDFESDLVTYHALGVALGEASLSEAALDDFLAETGLAAGRVHVGEGYVLAAS